MTAAGRTVQARERSVPVRECNWQSGPQRNALTYLGTRGPPGTASATVTDNERSEYVTTAGIVPSQAPDAVLTHSIESSRSCGKTPGREQRGQGEQMANAARSPGTSREHHCSRRRRQTKNRGRHSPPGRLRVVPRSPEANCGRC
ncbi:hypothetical protein OH76DRAFT_538495 [Lentinus brumalis]|uniref:Uncharacterized protein n=1 Tax=Lentinus brumalis TaxID=2498619 RepID=A0A371CHN0_9APHY|nr:hypothetical protein OH76DRAFT_538495 [Polyporus brumalis]